MLSSNTNTSASSSKSEAYSDCSTRRNRSTADPVLFGEGKKKKTKHFEDIKFSSVL